MNITSIQFPVFKPYNKPTAEIYIAGCTRACKGCCNPELQDFSHGSPLVWSELEAYLKERTQLFEVISIVGGDLLCQPAREAREFIDDIKASFPDKELWLFTGEDKVHHMLPWVFWRFDVIKYGSYKEELKQSGFPASSNQKVWVNPNTKFDIALNWPTKNVI